MYRAQSGTDGQTPSTLVSGTSVEQRVQQIMEMGGGSWDEETVIRALRAAYYNTERAVDYLYSVLPPLLCNSLLCGNETKLLKFGFIFREFLKAKILHH